MSEDVFFNNFALKYGLTSNLRKWEGTLENKYYDICEFQKVLTY